MLSQCSWLKCFKVIDSMLLQKWIYQAIKIGLNKMIFNIYKSVMSKRVHFGASLSLQNSCKIVAKSVMKWCLEL